MPKPKTPATSTGTTEPEKFECQLCGENAWRGPKCKECKLSENAHYTEGVGGVPGEVDFFCVANSPFLAGPSSSLVNHRGWTQDIEKVVRSAFIQTGKLNPLFRTLVGRFTYAVRCEKKKPVLNNINSCRPLFIEELLEYARPNVPIMVFAMGDTVLKALGLSVRKYSSVQEHFVETEIRGRQVYVYVSMSKPQLAAKTGYFDLFKNHIDLFLSNVVETAAGRKIEIAPTLEKLSKDYVFPKNIKEVEKIVDHIIDYTEGDTDPRNWVISIDTETNTKFPHRPKLKLLSVVVGWATGKATSIPIEHPGTPWSFEDVAPHIQRLLTCPKPKVLHNIKFDLKVLRRKGWEIRRIAWDTMLGEHLLVEDKKGFYGLKDLTNTMLPAYSGYEDKLQSILTQEEGDSQIADSRKKDAKEAKAPKLKGAAKKLADDTATEGFLHVPLTDLNVYGAVDGDVTRQLVALQRSRAQQENHALAQRRAQLARNIHFRELAQTGCNLPDPITSTMFHRIIPTTKVLADMELYGVNVDQDYIDELTVKMELSLQHSRTEMLPMIPPGLEFNPSSPHDLRKLLYGTGFRHPETGETVCYKGIIEPPMTETGQISTNAQFLRALATQHDCPLSGAVLRYRATHKALTTFVANIQALSAEDGRMHTNFHQHGTATYRLCVSADTVLDTNKGSFVISKLNLRKIPNVSILTHKGRMRPIKNVYYKGKEEMFCVELENGAKIKVTKNHRFHTPEGFKRLKYLQVGDLVTTVGNHFSASKRWNNPKLEGFRTLLPHRVFTDGRIQGTRSLLQNSEQFSKALQERVLTGNTPKKTSHVLNRPKREQARRTPTSVGVTSSGTSSHLSFSGVSGTADRAENAHECVVCARKCEVLQPTSNRHSAVLDGGERLGVLGGPRQILTRPFEKRPQLLRRPIRVLRTSIYGVHSTYGASLVCEGAGARVPLVLPTTQTGQRTHLLEYESSRTNALSRTVVRKNTPRTTSSISQKLHGRFRISGLESPGRGRWRVPPEGHDDKETRPPTYAHCTEKGIPDTAHLNSRSTNERRNHSGKNTFGTSRIVRVTSVGVEDVWDIEVAEDHSYIAQGFVNHNSSSDENMQNVPYRIGEHNIKKIFIPTNPDREIICNADAKAAEVRVYAAYSHDPNLIRALNDGMDPHSFFAGMVFNPDVVLEGVERSMRKVVMDTIGIDDEHSWSYDDFNNRSNFKDTDPRYAKQLDKLRKNIKRVVFGILYGASKYKISSIVGISNEQAQAIIDVLEKMFPSIPHYVSITKDQVRHIGVVETFLGRRRRFDMRGLTGYMRSKAERQAVNFKIQSTSSDLVLEVLCEVDDPIRHDFGGHLLITVHDSVVAEIPTKYVSQLPEFFEEYGVRRVAKRHPWLPVPFKWDVEVGPSYGEVIDIQEYMTRNDVPRYAREDPDDYLEQDIKAEFEKEVAVS